MSAWNPEHYLTFGDERTRPSVDLAARVSLEAPARVIDLGCGPGNSTAVLASRWPGAGITGLDSSAEMIAAAREAHPEHEWVLAGIEDWQPAEPFDLVFSNAALQWLPEHGTLVERLFSAVAPGGALAFQIPSAVYATVRTLIFEVSLDPAWAGRLEDARTQLTMESPGFYYDHLAPAARAVDIWETEYVHVMESHAAIVEWISSTGLRPFLDALDDEAERERFSAMLLDRVRDAYPTQVDGRVLFPFRRTFVIAYAR